LELVLELGVKIMAKQKHAKKIFGVMSIPQLIIFSILIIPVLVNLVLFLIWFF